MSERESPQPQIGCRIRNRTKNILNSMNNLVNHDIAEIELFKTTMGGVNVERIITLQINIKNIKIGQLKEKKKTRIRSGEERDLCSKFDPKYMRSIQEAGLEQEKDEQR